MYYVQNGGSEFDTIVNDFGECKLQRINHRWVTYRKPLVNIHKGGSGFILLSVTFVSP